jgi:citronellyl-CoA dehydrogenase
MPFSVEHELFRRTLREFVEREINPHVDGWERAGSFPAHELFPRLADLGMFGLEYDSVDGGQGANHLCRSGSRGPGDAATCS